MLSPFGDWGGAAIKVGVHISLLDPAFTGFIYICPEVGMGGSYVPHPSLQMQELKPRRRAQMLAQGPSVPTPLTPSSSVAYSQTSWKALWKRWAGMDTLEESGHRRHRKGSILGKGVSRRGARTAYG